MKRYKFIIISLYLFLIKLINSYSISELENIISPYAIKGQSCNYKTLLSIDHDVEIDFTPDVIEVVPFKNDKTILLYQTPLGITTSLGSTFDIQIYDIKGTRLLMSGIKYICTEILIEDKYFNITPTSKYQGYGGMSNRIITRWNWTIGNDFNDIGNGFKSIVFPSEFNTSVHFQNSYFFPSFRIFKDSPINPTVTPTMAISNTTHINQYTFQNLFKSNLNILDYNIIGVYPSNNITYLTSFYVIVNVTNNENSYFLLGDSKCIQYPISGNPIKSTEYISIYTNDKFESTVSIDFIISYFTNYIRTYDYKFRQTITTLPNPYIFTSGNLLIEKSIDNDQQYMVTIGFKTLAMKYVYSINGNLDIYFNQYFELPFGITSGTIDNSTTLIVNPVSKNHTSSYNIKIGKWAISSTSPIPLNLKNQIPYIYDINFNYIGSMRGIITLDLVDLNSTFLYSIFTDNYKVNIGNLKTVITTQHLISKGINFNRYQALIDFSTFNFSPNYFLIFDSTNEFRFYDTSSIINSQLKKFPTLPLSFNVTLNDIETISFSQEINNTRIIYIKINNVQLDYTFTFIPLFQFEDLPLNVNSNGPSKILNNQEYKGKYNPESQLFECTFIQPSNLYTGSVDYIIRFTPKEFISQEIILAIGSSAMLNVSSDWADQIGPLVISLKRTASTVTKPIPNTFVGFTIEISDSIGIKQGEIILTSNINPVPLIYKFSNVSFQQQYTLDMNINIGTCISQTWTISDGYLMDQNNFTTYVKPKNYRIHSFMKIINDFQSLSSITLDCLNTEKDIISPKLESYQISFPSGEFNIFSIDKRIVKLYFNITDETFLLYPNDALALYATDSMGKILKFKNWEILAGNGTYIEYSIIFELPFGFGFPNGIAISVYGISDTSYNLLGFTSTYEKPNLLISTRDDDVYPYINSTSKYEINGQLEIFGSYFGNNISDIIFYYNNNQLSIIDSPFLNSFLITPPILIDNDVETLNLSIKIISTGKLSNIFKINISSNSSSSSSNESSESNNLPTNSPQKCFNQCNNNGECTNNGCICKSPWVGLDCSSKVIFVQPIINNTSPFTNFNINENQSFVAIISIIALNEIDKNGNVVNRYDFNEWIVTNNSNSKYGNTNSTISYRYHSTLINENRSPSSMIIPTNITVDIDYFNITQPLNITFANQHLTMNPNSLKYSINLTRYEFESSFNSLQLVLLASIESVDQENECSSKQIGDVVESESEFIKIQMDKISLYGRFIKRGLIDNRVKYVSNTLLDSDYNSIETTSKTQTYIGINIPFYSKSVEIDPDFSILLDNTPASDQQTPLCSIKMNKHLSTSQLIGIIIGTIAFALVIIISISYFIYKRHKQRKQNNILMNKLNNLN